MKDQLIIETLNQLIEEERFDYAQNMIIQNQHLHQNVEFNDAYATLLYLLDEYKTAINVLDYNIHLILHKKYSEQWLNTSYFQLANCYAALGNSSEAEKYYDLCLTEQEKLELGVEFFRSNVSTQVSTYCKIK